MITVEKIIEWSKPHKAGMGGRQTIIGNELFNFSIVGGSPGLYGDFVREFEVAVINKKTGNFMTSFFFSGLSDDVIPRMPGEELVQELNRIFGNNFQVWDVKLGGGGVKPTP